MAPPATSRGAGQREAATTTATTKSSSSFSSSPPLPASIAEDCSKVVDAFPAAFGRILEASDGRQSCCGSDGPVAVVCQSDRVTELRCQNSFLGTPLSSSIGDLNALKLISFQNCSVSGSIPESIGQLANLTTLILDDNILSGEIPQSLSNAITLQQISLGRNFLTGAIPPLFLALPDLWLLTVEGNRLAGPIPDMFYSNKQRPSGLYLDFSFNFLSGPIPTSLKSAQLSRIDLRTNCIQDALPSSWTSTFPFALNNQYQSCPFSVTNQLHPATQPPITEQIPEGSVKSDDQALEAAVRGDPALVGIAAVLVCAVMIVIAAATAAAFARTRRSRSRTDRRRPRGRRKRPGWLDRFGGKRSAIGTKDGLAADEESGGRAAVPDALSQASPVERAVDVQADGDDEDSDVHTWTASEVATHLGTSGVARETVLAFLAREIHGAAFLNLTPATLQAFHAELAIEDEDTFQRVVELVLEARVRSGLDGAVEKGDVRLPGYTEVEATDREG
ncbi:hypothetical protein DFJ73DRAFT_965229 [Zopfochytrium polystomum]|nr:hypothetical protein DFJ73DRAFT_965229 [Zopfochytrium polystomum]